MALDWIDDEDSENVVRSLRKRNPEEKPVESPQKPMPMGSARSASGPLSDEPQPRSRVKLPGSTQYNPSRDEWSEIQAAARTRGLDDR